MPFNFALLSTLWSARSIEKIIADYEAALPAGAWPNWVLGNHDRPRVASRVGQDQARVAAMLLLTLRGTPTLYYGDEIGMRQVAIAPDQVRDPFEKNVPGIGVGRDGCRTPMQWDATSRAGFSTATPWLPLANDFVARKRGQSRCRRALHPQPLQGADRAATESCRSLRSGAYVPVAAEGDMLLYPREGDGEAVNDRTQPWDQPVSIASSAASAWPAKSCCRPFWTGEGEQNRRRRSICAAMRA